MLILITSLTDIAPPSIKCPASTEVSTETGQSYATVTWDVPVPTDNSNEHLNVSGLRPPQKLDFGKTYIRYKVTDSAGLSSNCVFSIDVKGAIRVMLVWPSNICTFRF